MRLLVLGGTEFVGHAVVDEALAAGWDVTTFNRGTRAPVEGAEHRIGDRLSDLSSLATGRWDAVVDTWSWAPSAVRDSAALLADRVGSYVYISSRSVYEPMPPAGGTESATLVDSSPDDESGDYARYKRGAELALVDVEHAVLARAGLVLGPRENVGRLPWWLGRIARGGDILAPGPATASIQYIDARDLARWCLLAAENRLVGAYNLVSDPSANTMSDLLEACLDVTGSDGRLRWVDADVVLEAGIQPWSDLPVWLPPGELHDGMHRSDVSKALASGLVVRPLHETVADTWSWLQSIGGTAPQRPDRPPVGLDPDLEARVLARLDS